MKVQLCLHTLAGLTAGLVLWCANSVMATSVAIDYSSSVGAYINFPGNGTFDFTPTVGNLNVTDGTAAGLSGEISGTFNIGTITGNTASVSGSGSFVINDGATPLTGTLTWVDIYQVGTGDGLNLDGVANLTDITYSGSNPDLVTLASIGTAADALTFQFVPAVTLPNLISSDKANETSFSGSVYATTSTTTGVPDGGLTVTLLGASLLALGGLRWKFGV